MMKRKKRRRVARERESKRTTLELGIVLSRGCKVTLRCSKVINLDDV